MARDPEKVRRDDVRGATASRSARTRDVPDPSPVVTPIVCTSEALAMAAIARLSNRAAVRATVGEMMDMCSERGAVAFVEGALLDEVDREAKRRGVPAPTAVIAICDGPLQSGVRWLAAFPWVSHVVSATMVQQPSANRHFENVVAALGNPARHKLLDWLGPEVAGRRIRLTHASRRLERLENMADYFADNGVSARTIGLLRDVADELLTNAFYDAPVAAGAVRSPIPRTQNVSLPDDTGCDMVYACSDDLAIVRVRDPFGSLSRARIVEVLNRCARSDMQVEVDSSMGGAGLGLWRIFAVASFVAISVVNHHHTEVLVGIRKRSGAGVRPFAFHLFFRDSKTRRSWELLHDHTVEQPAITLVSG